MLHAMNGTPLLIFVVFLIAECARSGPPSTDTSSDKLATLADKVAFLQQYVRFNRNYRQLDFSIRYTNNSGGMVPGPSDWDIRIVAQVPPAELPNWWSGLKPVASPDTEWVTSLRTAIDHSGVSRWFQDEGVLVGVDSTNSVVLYRNVSM